jgi:hypothetical protein
MSGLIANELRSTYAKKRGTSGLSPDLPIEVDHVSRQCKAACSNDYPA